MSSLRCLRAGGGALVALEGLDYAGGKFFVGDVEAAGGVYCDRVFVAEIEFLQPDGGAVGAADALGFAQFRVFGQVPEIGPELFFELRRGSAVCAVDGGNFPFLVDLLGALGAGLGIVQAAEEDQGLAFQRVAVADEVLVELDDFGVDVGLFAFDPELAVVDLVAVLVEFGEDEPFAHHAARGAGGICRVAHDDLGDAVRCLEALGKKPALFGFVLAGLKFLAKLLDALMVGAGALVIQIRRSAERRQQEQEEDGLVDSTQHEQA